jgi:hypothetical protein
MFDLPDKPKKAFGCGVLASLQLVADEILQGVGLERRGELAVFNFLKQTQLYQSCHSVRYIYSLVALRSLPP